MTIEKFEQLDAWREAHSLVLQIYRAARCLPGDERYGLAAQMRRAAVSIPANIAEGFKRRGSRDKVHFYNISQSSLEELRYYVILCRDLDYLADVETLSNSADHVGRLLTGLVRAVRC